ncbi:hypothetical protein [Streptomyces rishiriensis]|uniref:hypothetical protein n=1 Tax=Streptomyces rishiriensis TaxID=68264 RepID=UPI0027D8F1CF|nr:hypothetical protein [Streptomyces rishiriensis]
MPPPDACRNCLAWGAAPRRRLCQGCAAWCYRHTTRGACTVCAHTAVLDGDGICRLCRKQAALTRSLHTRTDWSQVRRHGQQLFIADLFTHHGKSPAHNPPATAPADPAPPEPACPDPAPPEPACPDQVRPEPACPDQVRPEPARPDQVRPGPPGAGPAPLEPVWAAGFRQPALFEVSRSLRHRGGTEGLARRADPHLAAWTDRFITERALREGWDRDLSRRVSTGTRIALGFLDTPGVRLTSTDVAVLKDFSLPAARITAVLEATGLLDDDRVPALTRWSEQRIAPLPADMAVQVRTWLAVMRDGSTTPPRRRPRTETTIRLHLYWALPALTGWAAAGKTTLREITPADVDAALPPADAHRSQMCQALRSIFRVLKARRLLFTDPTTQLRPGSYNPLTPLPLPVQHIRDALTSPDPATALLTALLAFHGLSAHEVQHLKLTHLDGPRLHLEGRTVVLAGPVRDRLTAYLDHRTQHWPATTNPHLFIHFRSATSTAHVSHDWIHHRLGPHLSARALRNDRLLHEALATGGDTKRLIDLFGLSTRAAQRYTACLGHSDPGQTP